MLKILYFFLYTKYKIIQLASLFLSWRKASLFNFSQARVTLIELKISFSGWKLSMTRAT